MPRSLVDMMRQGAINPREAILAAEVDWLDGTHDTQDGGGCTATNEYLGAIVGLDPRRVRSSLAHLISLGILHRAGDDEHRVLRSNLRGFQLITNVATNDEPQSRPPPKQRKQPDREDAYIQRVFAGLAARLAEAIARRHKVHCSSNLSVWARTLHKLNRMDGVSVERITTAIEALMDPNIYDHQYCPVVSSATALREKFLRLELHIKRVRGQDAGAVPTHNGDVFT